MSDIAALGILAEGARRYAERPVAVAAFIAALALRHALQLWLTRRRSGSLARRSGWVSTVLLFVCYVSAMGLALAGIARGASPWAALGVGGALWSCAVAFRIWALAHLRECFSSLIEIRSAHRLVESGPYRIIRHPLHLAFGLEVTAFAVAAWSSWAVAPAVLVWITVLVRNRTEEAAMRAHFGEEYDAYRGRVPAMNVLRGLARRLVGTRRS